MDTDGGYNGSLHLVGRYRHFKTFVVIVAVISLSLYCTVVLESAVNVFISIWTHSCCHKLPNRVTEFLLISDHHERTTLFKTY